MSNDSAGALGRVVERLFRSYEDISYLAILDDKLKVVVQRGFTELHPTKLHVLHVQASLLVNMSSVWSESLGSLDYICASFDSKSEIMAMGLPNRMHLVAVLSSVHKKSVESIRMEIIRQFRSIKVTP